MSNIYGRKYSLIFGKPAHRAEVDSFDIQVQNQSGVFTAPVLTARQYEDIPENFHEITDLHIVAVLPQSLTSSASSSDKGYIEVYNASQDTIKKLQNSTHIFLKAGYQQDKELQYVFVGDIQRVGTERRGSDIVSTIVCGQRIRAGKDVRVQRTFTPPTSFTAILDNLLDVARKNGISIGRVRLPSATRVYAPGQVFVDSSAPLGVITRSIATQDYLPYHINSPIVIDGYILDEISRVATMANCRSYMVLGSLYIEPLTVTQTVEVYDVQQDNVQGGINRSQSISDSDYSETKEEISLKLFLDPRVTVGSYISIDWKDYNDVQGVFKVSKVEHLLEYEGNNWTTEVTAMRVDNA